MKIILLICVAVLFFNKCMASDSECSAPECINSGNADLSTMILCNACVVKGVSAVELHTFRQKINSISAKNDTPKTIADLNVDVLLLIFEHLVIKDILNLAKAQPSPTIYTAVKHAFWTKYKDYTVHVSKEHSTKDIHFNDGIKKISILTKKAAKILKIIGSGIQDLTVSYPTATIIQCVSKFTADSLLKLDLYGIENDTFVHINQPFKRLEVLKFDYSRYDESRIDQLSLNQQFPKLRNLTLSLDRNINIFNFSEFPHLEHLRFNVERLTWDQVEVIFRKNPQIRSLHITSLSQNMTNIIGRHLVYLENLTVTQIDITNNTRIENVKHLVLNYNTKAIHKLSLPCLETMDLEYTERLDYLRSLGEFFTNHQMLKKLKIRNCRGNDVNSGLLMLTLNSNSLIELVVEGSNEYIYSATFFEIIEYHPELKRFNITKGYFQQETLDALQGKLENDWNIISNDYNVSLEKKN